MAKGSCVRNVLPRAWFAVLAVEHAKEIAEVDDHFTPSSGRSRAVYNDASKAFPVFTFWLVEEGRRTDFGDPDEFRIIEFNQFGRQSGIEEAPFGVVS